MRMRNFVTMIALLFAYVCTVVPLTGTTASAIFTEEGSSLAPQKPQASARSANHTGPWAVGCGIASAGSLMIGTAIHAGDKTDPRQLTINEAGWHSAACPFLLPWALMVQAMCPDNKATFQVARLAFRFLRKHQGGDQSAFTNAYGEACRTGKLSRDTLRTLNGLI